MAMGEGDKLLSGTTAVASLIVAIGVIYAVSRHNACSECPVEKVGDEFRFASSISLVCSGPCPPGVTVPAGRQYVATQNVLLTSNTRLVQTPVGYDLVATSTEDGGVAIERTVLSFEVRSDKVYLRMPVQDTQDVLNAPAFTVDHTLSVLGVDNTPFSVLSAKLAGSGTPAVCVGPEGDAEHTFCQISDGPAAQMTASLNKITAAYAMPYVPASDDTVYTPPAALPCVESHPNPLGLSRLYFTRYTSRGLLSSPARVPYAVSKNVVECTRGTTLVPGLELYTYACFNPTTCNQNGTLIYAGSDTDLTGQESVPGDYSLELGLSEGDTLLIECSQM